MTERKSLTPESFDQLLKTLSSDQTEAAAAYAKLRDSLVRFFQIKGDYAPETAADETLDRIALKLSESAKIEDLTKYGFGVARFIFLERLRSTKKEKVAAEGFYNGNNSQKNDEDRDIFLPFRECFDELANDDKMFMQSYFADLPYAELLEHRQKSATQNNFSIDYLRLKVFRLRRRLKDCVRGKSGK